MELGRIGCCGGYIGRLVVGKIKKQERMDRRRWGRMHAELGEGMVGGVGLGKWMSCARRNGYIEYMERGIQLGIARDRVSWLQCWARP